MKQFLDGIGFDAYEQKPKNTGYFPLTHRIRHFFRSIDWVIAFVWLAIVGLGAFDVWCLYRMGILIVEWVRR